MRTALLALGAVAFAVPHSAVGGGPGSLSIKGGCGDPGLMVTISFDRPQEPAPDHHPCCDRLACHAATERNKKSKRP